MAHLRWGPVWSGWAAPVMNSRGRYVTSDWGQDPQQHEQTDSEEENQGHANTGFAVDLGHEVGGGHIDGDSSGEREASLNPAGQEPDDEHAGNGSGGEADGGGDRRAARASGGQHDRRHREALGHLVEDDGDEDQPAEAARDHEAGGDGHAVEERVRG